MRRLIEAKILGGERRRLGKRQLFALRQIHLTIAVAARQKVPCRQRDGRIDPVVLARDLRFEDRMRAPGGRHCRLNLAVVERAERDQPNRQADLTQHHRE